MIKIQRNITLKNIEKLYTDLSNNKDSKVDLLLPLDIDSKDFSVIPSLIQFVGTWRRHPNCGRLLTRTDINELESIREFDNTEIGFASVVLAWENGISDKSDTDIKQQLKPCNEEIHSKMKSITNVVGNSLLLTCFDHIPKEKGLLNCFYPNNRDFISNEEQLNFFLDRGLKLVLRTIGNKSKENLISKIFMDIRDIVYELLKNTHEWARTDEQNKILNPNLRGIYLKFHRSKIDSYRNNYKELPQLDNYFKHDFVLNENSEAYFLEVSVFDTGPGFIKRNLELFGGNFDKLSISEQVSIVKFCLSKNGTGEQSYKSTFKGKGLDRILHLLDNKGFLRIRTNNLSLFRDLKSNPYQENVSVKNYDDIQIHDFQNAEKIDSYQYADGALVSIVYPIDFTLFSEVVQRADLFLSNQPQIKQ